MQILLVGLTPNAPADRIFSSRGNSATLRAPKRLLLTIEALLADPQIRDRSHRLGGRPWACRLANAICSSLNLRLHPPVLHGPGPRGVGTAA